jgi:hypothetical protein
VGVGKGQFGKGAQKVQRLCGQVSTRGEVSRRKQGVVEHQELPVARRFKSYVGSFKVLEKKLSDTYKLELPENLRVIPHFMFLF